MESGSLQPDWPLRVPFRVLEFLFGLISSAPSGLAPEPETGAETDTETETEMFWRLRTSRSFESCHPNARNKDVRLLLIVTAFVRPSRGLPHELLLSSSGVLGRVSPCYRS